MQGFLTYISVLFGLGLLIISSNFFVDATASVARQFRISPLITGIVIIGFATSTPEILVGIDSAIKDKVHIAVGNSVGSNIANIGLILGITALFFPFEVHSVTIKKIYVLMFVSMIIPLVLIWPESDLELTRSDSVILLSCLMASFFLLMKIAKNISNDDPVTTQFSSELGLIDNKSVKKIAIILVISFLFMLAGAECLVLGAVDIAKEFGASDLVIGLTIVAIGTSLPETATAITSLIKNKADIAIGNIIGSNMFNMLAVLGIPAFIRPASHIDTEILNRDFLVMFLLSALLAILLFSSNKVKLSRLGGLILLLCFLAYQFIIYRNTIGS